MADDVTFTSGNAATPPSGLVVATDDVGGKQHQRVKIDLGGDGVSSPLVRGSLSRANSLPVGLSTEDVAALAAILTSVVLAAGSNLIGSVTAVGDVAAGAADSGKPVKIGGKYLSTKTTLSDAQRGDVQLGSRGALAVQIMGVDAGNGITSLTGGADTMSTGSVGLAGINLAAGFNGGSWDRTRNNNTVTLLASAARTATSTGADQINYNNADAYLVVDVTAGSGFGLTVALQMKDSVSGKYITIHAAFTKLTTTGTYTYFFGKGTPVAAGGVTAVSGFRIPRDFRLVVTADDATSATYSAGILFAGQ